MIKSEYDVVVVGAGPAGSMAARFAAEQGISVLLLEKDRDVGYPVRCAEAVSLEGIKDYIEPDKKFIASTITSASFNAPDGTEVRMNFDQKGYILERRIFDYELAKTAIKAGAQLLTRSYVNGLLFENDVVSGVTFEYQGEQHSVKAQAVIGADGVESRVGRWAGIRTYTDFRDMESAVQVTAGNIPVDNNCLYFYFGKDIAPEGYFWVFPKPDNTANIGLGVSGLIGKKKSALSYLNDFMKNHFPDAPILTQVAGGVPSTATLETIAVPGLILVGDAARQVNPVSGGGIASGMIGGHIGGTIVGQSIKNNDPDLLLSYPKLWHDRLGKRHQTFDRLKDGIYKLSDEQFNKIAAMANKIPKEKFGLGNLFKVALLNNPSLIVDVAKVFVIK